MKPACAHLFLLLFAPLAAHAADVTFVGRARDLQTGALLYVESHAVSGAGEPRETRVVTYHCANGTAFARKTLDFSADRIAPAFLMTDARSGVSEGLERTARGMTVTMGRAGAPPRSKALATIPDLVADAGFDEFVRERWDALDKGEILVIPFLVPSRLDAVKFRVRKAGDATIGGQGVSVFRLSVAGPLGWLLPDIDVSYRRGDRRLLRYRGITNIRDAAGEMISAQIDFADADRSAGAVDLAALRARPLATCGS